MENGNLGLVEIVEGFPMIIDRRPELPRVPIQHIRNLVTYKSSLGGHSTLYELYPLEPPTDNVELYLM
jgi:hypothetical protein